MFKEGDLITPTQEGKEFFASWTEGCIFKLIKAKSGANRVILVRKGHRCYLDIGHNSPIEDRHMRLFRSVQTGNDIE